MATQVSIIAETEGAEVLQDLLLQKKTTPQCWRNLNAVYAFILKETYNNPMSVISQQLISRILNISDRTVRRLIKRLRELGLITTRGNGTWEDPITKKKKLMPLTYIVISTKDGVIYKQLTEKILGVDPESLSEVLDYLSGDTIEDKERKDRHYCPHCDNHQSVAILKDKEVGYCHNAKCKMTIDLESINYISLLTKSKHICKDFLIQEFKNTVHGKYTEHTVILPRGHLQRAIRR